MQITEQQIAWEDLSRGFHGGRIDSEEVETFDYSDEKQYISFSVRQYTSERTDFFGVYVDAWELFVFIRDVRFMSDEREYETETKWRIGEDYARAEYAQEFAEYVVESIKKHGNISRLPFSEMCDD